MKSIHCNLQYSNISYFKHRRLNKLAVSDEDHVKISGCMKFRCISTIYAHCVVGENRKGFWMMQRNKEAVPFASFYVAIA